MSVISWDDMDDELDNRPVSIPPVGGLVDSLLSERDEPEIQLNTPVIKENIGQDSVDAAKLDQIMLDPLAMLSERFTNPKEVAALDYLRGMDLMNGAIDTTGEPIQAHHKSIIRGSSDVNQLIPFKYEWAWTKYLDGSANHWMPQEVQMQRDIAQWKEAVGSPNGLTEEERMIVMRALGFFSTADSVVMNNLVVAVYEWITSPEHRQYIATQIKEESIHQHAYQYCVESLQMDQQFVFNMYRKVPSMTLKSAWCIKYTYSTKREDYATDDDYDRAMIKNLISQYVVMEGIFFYCGFASVLSMGRRNKLPGVCEQFQYILRDECVTEDTELLTPHGWVNVTEITKESLIAQWETDGGITFVHPTQLSRTEVDHVYEFSNQQNHINQCVSENHRMVYITKNNMLKVVEAKDATPNPYCKFINVGLKVGGEEELSLYERFLVAVQADGSIDTRSVEPGKFSGTQRVAFHLVKERKQERLRMLVDSLGWKMTETENSVAGKNFHVFVPLDYPLYKFFSDWVDLGKISFNWGQDFIYEISQWDGSVIQSKPLRIHYGNTSKADVDLVQAVCSLSGYRTCLKTTVDHRSETYSDYHRLFISTHIDVTMGGSVDKKRIDGKHMVYGVQVPSTFMMIRRKGAVSVTGNSMHLNFGVDTINQIRIEFPHLFNAQLMLEIEQMIIGGTLLEIAFAYDTTPRGVLGYNAEGMEAYLKFICNRRLEQLGIKPHFEEKPHPFSWMSEMMDLRKEKNFFETRVTDYQTGGALSFD